MNIQRKTLLIPDNLIHSEKDRHFLEKLYKEKIDFLLLSQQKSYSDWQKKLVFLKEKQFYSTSRAALQYICTKKKNPKVAYLGSNRIKQEIVNYGVELDFSRPDYVLIGRKSVIDEQEIAMVISQVEFGAKLICLDSRKTQSVDGQVSFGASSLAWMIAYACNQKLYAFGLHSKAFQRCALSFLKKSHEDVLRLCRSMKEEVPVCSQMDITSILVSEGQEIDLTHNDGNCPDYLIDTLDGIFK
ncbi:MULTISPECIES: hypothetical protein [Terrabacteria group]|uniref:hypothetical protein n=1 Tax=Bacillati TaxID=1783272 RepID=UPI00193A0BF7|nr:MULTISPECIES: hypothetical protein [Terrabacteria group]MBW9213056.1 hypothetical protein [Trueperella sp. zg.1013]QRG87431.1 hypothetical protein JOS54_03740 [Bulleidia sp. zg-1006]